MELKEAMAYVDSLNLNDVPMDFSQMTNQQLMKIIINVHLISKAEAKLFVDELEKRGLSKQYHERYKPKAN